MKKKPYKGSQKLAEYHKKYREKHREEKNLYMRDYIKRPEIIKRRNEYGKQYRKENKEHIKIITNQWLKANREYVRKDWNRRYSENREHYNELSRLRGRKYTQKLKYEVMSYYSSGSPKCSCCNENRVNLLNLDHVDGRKAINHKKALTGVKMYSWIRNNDFPEGFQVLCYNCNMSKGFYGICGHEIEKKEDFIKEFCEKNNNKITDRYKKHYYSVDFQRGLLEKKKFCFNHYCNGIPKCKCCNEKNIYLLTIEHIKGRKNYEHDQRKGGYKLVSWLINHGFPKDFEVLCYNCNLGFARFGYCHKITHKLAK